MQKARRKINLTEGLAGYLFSAPAIIGFLLFTAGPMLVSLYYSFTEFSILKAPSWIGLRNYVTMLTSPSSLFLKSLKVTLLYALINAVITMIFSIATALLLNRQFRLRGLLRAIYFMPHCGNYSCMELDSRLQKRTDEPVF